MSTYRTILDGIDYSRFEIQKDSTRDIALIVRLVEEDILAIIHTVRALSDDPVTVEHRGTYERRASAAFRDGAADLWIPCSAVKRFQNSAPTENRRDKECEVRVADRRRGEG